MVAIKSSFFDDFFCPKGDIPLGIPLFDLTILFLHKYFSFLFLIFFFSLKFSLTNCRRGGVESYFKEGKNENK